MLVETVAPQRSHEMASFRSRLKELMLKKSVEVQRPLTQTEVAKEAGVSFATVQRVYDGTFKRIDADTLYGLLDYFDCKFEDLIERVDE